MQSRVWKQAIQVASATPFHCIESSSFCNFRAGKLELLCWPSLKGVLCAKERKENIATAQGATLNLRTQLTPANHHHHDDYSYHYHSHKVNRVNWINWVQPGHLGQAGTPCSTGSTGTAHLLAPYADALDLCFDAQACNGMLESCTEIRSLQSISTDFHRSVAEASFKCCQQCTWKSRLGPLPSEAHPIRGGPFITFFFPSEARNHWLG